MNMQIFRQTSTHSGAGWRRWAARAALPAIASMIIAGAVGPSTAEPGGLAGSWSGGGWVSFASGAKEKARCRARYTGSGGSYTVNATCATSSGKASQTATVHKVSGSAYRGTFVNTEFNVRGTIRVVVHGKSQSVSLSGDGASAQLSLSRR